MRWWPWSRPRDEEAVADAAAELRDARARLDAARRQGQEAGEVAASLRELRRRNHFGPMIERALRGSG